jgi:hypothetical protein
MRTNTISTSSEICILQSKLQNKKRQKKLVWIDEAVFTFNTFNTKAWSGKYSSIQVNDADAKIKTVALLAGISEDCGQKGHSIHSKSISTQDFVDFVDDLFQLFDGK